MGLLHLKGDIPRFAPISPIVPKNMRVYNKRKENMESATNIESISVATPTRIPNYEGNITAHLNDECTPNSP